MQRRDRRFQAEIGGRKIDLSIDGDQVSIGDRRVTVTHENLSKGHMSLLINGRSVSATVLPAGDNRYRVFVNGRAFDVHLKNERDLLLERFGLAAAAGAGIQYVVAPMPGLVLSVFAEPGKEIRRGAGLVVLEAMKMENELRADRDGVVRAVHVSPGDAVGKNDLLVEIE